MHDRTKKLFEDTELFEINKKNGINGKENEILSQLEKESEELKESILSNPIFMNLNNTKKRKLKKNNPDWKIFGNWHDLAVLASLRESRFNYDYSLLSSSTHSGKISTSIYNYENQFDDEFKAHINNAVYLLHLVLCKMILEFCDLFELKAILKKQSEIFPNLQKELLSGIQIGFFTNSQKLSEYVNSY